MGTDTRTESGKGIREAGERASEQIADLHAIASAHFRSERSDHTLQPTAIVSEAWIRLMRSPHTRFETPAAFRSWASSVVRHILVDHARAKGAAKRGGDWQRAAGVDPDQLESPATSEDILRLHEALLELGKRDPMLARIVEMRFFGGMSLIEIAAEMNLDELKVRADWSLARAMIRGMMQSGDR